MAQPLGTLNVQNNQIFSEYTCPAGTGLVYQIAQMGAGAGLVSTIRPGNITRAALLLREDLLLLVGIRMRLTDVGDFGAWVITTGLGLNADARGFVFDGPILGTGTPLNVVLAPVGTMFLRRDGGAVTTQYTKESGLGNTSTGWVAK